MCRFLERSPVAKKRNKENSMQAGQTTIESSHHPLTIGEAAEALGMFPSAVHRSINCLKDGGTLPGNTDIDFENGCFRKVG